MATFEFKKINWCTGTKCPVLQLSIDKVNQLDAFEKDIEDELAAQFTSLMAYIDHYSKSSSIPEAKCKEITPKKAKYKEFEFRTKNGIRLYAVQSPNGRIIVLCGYKGGQKRDINRFRQLVKTIFP